MFNYFARARIKCACALILTCCFEPGMNLIMYTLPYKRVSPAFAKAAQRSDNPKYIILFRRNRGFGRKTPREGFFSPIKYKLSRRLRFDSLIFQNSAKSGILVSIVCENLCAFGAALRMVALPRTVYASGRLWSRVGFPAPQTSRDQPDGLPERPNKENYN